MLKIQLVFWPGQFTQADLDEATQGWNAQDLQVMHREWKKDSNFVEFGLFSRNMALMEHLARTFGATRIWTVKPPQIA